MKTIKVDKVVLYYMDRVDPDGNLYRFYMYKGMASEIEYFCTEEAGNMTIPIGEGKYVKIVPKEIERIPVRGYRKLAGIWNCETCNGKGWYRLFNYFKYKPTLCYFKKAGHDENGNTRYEISLFNATMNVTRYFNLWRMKPGKHAMITNECGALDIIKEKFENKAFMPYRPIKETQDLPIDAKYIPLLTGIFGENILAEIGGGKIFITTGKYAVNFWCWGK